jgi:hypothetical protein
MAELGHGVGSIPSTASDEATQNANLPTAAQKAALAGTGTPSSGNKYATADYVTPANVPTSDQKAALTAADLLDTTHPVMTKAYTVTAGETLAFGDCAYLDSADSGKAKKAINNDTSEKADAFGFVATVAGIANGATGVIYFTGLLTNAGWALTAGAPVYVGATAAAITNTMPVAGYVKPMGKAVSATQIRINPATGWAV